MKRLLFVLLLALYLPANVMADDAATPEVGQDLAAVIDKAVAAKIDEAIAAAIEKAATAAVSADKATADKAAADRAAAKLKIMKNGKVFPDDYVTCDDEYCAEIYNKRAYVKPGKKFPPELKCSDVDKRWFHGCVEARFFNPSTRVYFDSGVDDANEIDLFNDGNLNISIDVVSLYLPWRMGKGVFYDKWSWGPLIGAGISAAGDDSSDGTAKASDAPIVIFSVGGVIEYKTEENGASFAFEVGKAYGVSADESFEDNDDSATYVGLKINIPIGKKPEVKTQESKDK